MKKIYYVVIFLLLIMIAAFLSNPNLEMHQNAVKTKLKLKMQQETQKESKESNALASAGQLLGNMIGDVFINEMTSNFITSNNYLFFSTTQLLWEGDTKTIGVGILGNVFIPESAVDEAFNNNQTNEENPRITSEKAQVDSLYSVVVSDLNEQQVELAHFRTDNRELKAILQEHKDEIQRQKAEIEIILKKSNPSHREIERAQRMIKKLIAENKKYLTQIETKITDLQNVSLTTHSTKSSSSLFFEPFNFVGEAVRLRSEGKESTTNRAERADKLKFCFDIDENNNIQRGAKELYLRIITPNKQTLTNPKSSDEFINPKGEKIKYSRKLSFDYEHSGKRLCTYWDRTTQFEVGIYHVLLYQDGKEIGSTVFELK